MYYYFKYYRDVKLFRELNPTAHLLGEIFGVYCVFLPAPKG